MKVDIIANQLWIDVDQPQLDVDCQPPLLKVPLAFSHTFGDRSSEFLMQAIQLKFSKIRVSSQQLQLILQPGSRTEKVVLEFPLYREISQLIEDEREKMHMEDLKFSLNLQGSVIQRLSSGSVGAGPYNVSREIQLTLSLSEWKKALGLTEHQLIPLSNDVVNELEDLRKKWGFWRIEDVITKFLEFYKGEKVGISQQLLVTLYETKTIRDKLAELAEKSANIKEVRIASPYLDNAGAEYIIKMLKNKVDVKLITRRSDKKAHIDALNSLKAMGAKIKIDGMMHARVIIFDDVAAVVSSADLDSEGLNNQKQVGIFTTDKVVIRDAIVFFDKAWSLAEEY